MCASWGASETHKMAYSSHVAASADLTVDYGWCLVVPECKATPNAAEQLQTPAAGAPAAASRSPTSWGASDTLILA